MNRTIQYDVVLYYKILYIHMYMHTDATCARARVCVCVCVCARARQREREGEFIDIIERKLGKIVMCYGCCFVFDLFVFLFSFCCFLWVLVFWLVVFCLLFCFMFVYIFKSIFQYFLYKVIQECRQSYSRFTISSSAEISRTR